MSAHAAESSKNAPLGLGPPGLPYLFSREVEELQLLGFPGVPLEPEHDEKALTQDLDEFRARVDRSYANLQNDLEDLYDLTALMALYCRSVVDARATTEAGPPGEQPASADEHGWKYGARHIHDAAMARKYALASTKKRGRERREDDGWQELPALRRQFRVETQELFDHIRLRRPAAAVCLGLDQPKPQKNRVAQSPQNTV